jgi:NitT/TauT family transport system substrate-binding protein
MLATFACTPADEVAPPPPDHVRAVVIPVLFTAPFHIAQAEGYFSDENLDVEFVRLTRNIDAIPALAQGQVDVGAGQLTIAMLNAIGGGARIRAVAGVGHLAGDGCTAHGIVVQREVLEGREDTGPDMFRDLTVELDIALPAAYWFEKALEPAGLTLDDLEIVDVPTAATVESFINGAYDATCVSDPRLTQILESGRGALWKGTEEIVPGYQRDLVFFGPNLLDERTEVGVRFLKAVLRGVQQLNLGKTERNLEILEAAMRLSREELTDACWASVYDDGHINAEGYQGYQEWAMQRGLVDRLLAAEDMIDTSLLDRANAELAR